MSLSRGSLYYFWLEEVHPCSPKGSPEHQRTRALQEEEGHDRRRHHSAPAAARSRETETRPLIPPGSQSVTSSPAHISKKQRTARKYRDSPTEASPLLQAALSDDTMTLECEYQGQTINRRDSSASPKRFFTSSIFKKNWSPFSSPTKQITKPETSRWKKEHGNYDEREEILISDASGKITITDCQDNNGKSYGTNNGSETMNGKAKSVRSRKDLHNLKSVKTKPNSVSNGQAAQMEEKKGLLGTKTKSGSFWERASQFSKKMAAKFSDRPNSAPPLLEKEPLIEEGSSNIAL